ncbi:substrate-binding domain-containing protein [Acidiphilium acidophilum]|uniref:substrate-binding domain-containing protein n=1 Tax=Acidiphilium acidophilum TaxID=76588 RepID=UPI002E8E74E3|nr:substrate-binding domain-containing protein [Acidiphilium acidophilum]
MLKSSFIGLALIASLFGAEAAHAEAPIHVYGPGGPAPAMQEAAKAFGAAHHVEVLVVAGPTIDPASVEPLYLRPAAILVRPGNPDHITGITDLFKPGHHILVVNGAGQQGLWEDVAGRTGSIADIRGFRHNIAMVAGNSAAARADWIKDKSLDAWLIWNIWQVANPSLATTVPIAPRYAIYRDAGIALTHAGEARPMVRQFAAFLASAKGKAIFTKWGWQ